VAVQVGRLAPEDGSISGRATVQSRSAFPFGDNHYVYYLRHALVALTLWLSVAASSPSQVAAPALHLPLKPGSVRFAVIGDAGRGTREQQEVADRMRAAHTVFPFEFTIMLGDNIYEYKRPEDYISKFEKPYAALLAQGVRFFAALGNHDPANEEHYAGFNMEGRRYYTFSKGHVRFFVLDSTSLSPGQMTWLAEELSASDSEWKIVYMHHPLYTSGRYTWSARALRLALEPLLIEHGVNVVFSGHEHFYERFKPQNGITYFISGGAGSLRKGDIRPDGRMAAGFDTDFHFMLVEVAGDELYFQAVDRQGRIVDSGTFRR
jgi:predicted phosphodiesterase